MKADGKGWLFAPSGLVDGPLPAHYEPYESPVPNLVYPGQASNPVAKVYNVPGNPYAAVGLGRVPVRPLDLPPDRAPPERLDEPLAALARRHFSPSSSSSLAPSTPRRSAWSTWTSCRSITPRAAIRAKALVTPRIRPFLIDGKTDPPRRHALALGIQGDQSRATWSTTSRPWSATRT